MSSFEIYLGKETVYKSPKNEQPIRLAALHDGDWYRGLRASCIEREKETGTKSFALTHDETSYRVSVMQSTSDYIYILRKRPDAIMNIGDLGLPKAYLSKLLVPGLTGLVLIAGATASGKTTTASSCIAERLKLYGGVGVSCEDPPELPLCGAHGKGIFFQTDVSVYGSFGAATREMVRMTPDIMFLGEIRDADTALEAFRAGVNGHLVFATLHAGSAINALLRLKSLVADGQINELNALLADGLAAVLYQQRSKENDKVRMDSEFIHISSETGGNGLRSLIRAGKYEQLSTNIIDNRNRALHMNGM